MAKTIKVSGAGDDRKVVLWEKNADHPNGEVMISNDGAEHEVAETAAVKRLMAEGTLVSAGAKTTTTAAPAKPDDKKN